MEESKPEINKARKEKKNQRCKGANKWWNNKQASEEAMKSRGMEASQPGSMNIRKTGIGSKAVRKQNRKCGKKKRGKETVRK